MTTSSRNTRLARVEERLGAPAQFDAECERMADSIIESLREMDRRDGFDSPEETFDRERILTGLRAHRLSA